jgi:hypothetical protein
VEKVVETKIKSSAGYGLIRNLCFASFGVVIFSNPLDRFNIFSLVVGVIVCLFFGWLFKKFLRGFLGMMNPELKKELGKKAIHYVVDSGMLFLVPFALMSLIATFYLDWGLTPAFMSTGIMAVGTASAIEISKLKNKQEIKNTVTTALVSFVFSFILTFSISILVKAPGLLEAAANLIPAIISKVGGGQ